MLSINGTGQFYKNDYLTDKITNYALDFLKSVKGNFFMTLAPPACHDPFTPAPRHRDLFPNLETVKGTPFNSTPMDVRFLTL